MEIRQIDDNYSVTGQINPDDVRDIAAEGFQTIICNRPDGEGGEEQPDFEEIARVAEKAGLAAYYIPAVGGQLTRKTWTTWRLRLPKRKDLFWPIAARRAFYEYLRDRAEPKARMKKERRLRGR